MHKICLGKMISLTWYIVYVLWGYPQSSMHKLKVSHSHNAFHKKEETSWQDIWHTYGQCSSYIVYFLQNRHSICLILFTNEMFLPHNTPSVLDKQKINIFDPHLRVEKYPCMLHPSHFRMTNDVHSKTTFLKGIQEAWRW